MEQFELRNIQGMIFAFVVIDGVEYHKNVTDYFKERNDLYEWLANKLSINIKKLGGVE